jgi:hypothetical protein
VPIIGVSRSSYKYFNSLLDTGGIIVSETENRRTAVAELKRSLHNRYRTETATNLKRVNYNGYVTAVAAGKNQLVW